MTVYDSAYTGPEIDTALGLAITALQPGEGGIVTYEDTSSLPLTGVTSGTLALVRTTLQGDSAVFLWNGTPTEGGWYKLATVNLSPSITTGPDAAYSIPTDGTPIVLTLEAEDPEGLPITWSYQVASGDPAGVASVVQVDNQFTITGDPGAISSGTSGAFSLTFVASDGVSLSAATSSFSLTFVIVVDMATYTVTQSDVSVPSTPTGLSGLNQDGTLWWRASSLTSSTLYYHVLSTPFDLSSAGPEQSFNVGGNIRGLMFVDDNTKFVLNNGTSGNADLFTMPAANDIQNATLDSSIPDIGNGLSTRVNGFVTNDGLHAYYANGTDGVVHFEMTTAWDFSTAVEAESNGVTDCRGIYVSGDGTQLIIFGAGGAWQEWTLATPFDISSGGSPIASGTVDKDYNQFLSDGKGYAHSYLQTVADIFTYGTK